MAAWPNCWLACGSSATRNVFGATAFATYGRCWIGLALWARLVAPAPAGAGPVVAAAHTVQATHDLGWILLAFAIFNTYMLLWSTMVNGAAFGVFLTLEATEIILFIGFFAKQRHNRSFASSWVA